MHPEQVIAAIRFDPLLPVWLLVALGVLSLAVVALGVWRRGRGTLLRLAAFAVLLLWLAGPRLVQETRESLRDIGLLVVDQSASMQVGDRAHLAEIARQSIQAQAAHLPDLELRTITVPESGNAGTQLFAAIDRALADIPRSRLAGTIAITDGQIHDVPKAAPGGAPAEPAAGRQRRGNRPPPAGHRGPRLRHRRQVRHPARRHRRSRHQRPHRPRHPDRPP